MISSFFAITVSLFLLSPLVSAGDVAHQSTSLACGSNAAWPVSYQITTPPNWSGKKFAIFIQGSPVTQYWSAGEPNQVALETALLNRGVKVLEVKYASAPLTCGASGTQDGFYAACCGAGWTNVQNHNSNLYSSMISALGYNPSDSTQSLYGVGFSLGGLQLEQMAFYAGNQFTSVAITGVLGGDFTKGCTYGQSGVSSLSDKTQEGISFYLFMFDADSITVGDKGCSNNLGAPTGFLPATNFGGSGCAFAGSSNLGLFEGNLYEAGAHDKQANYIADVRKGLSAPVTNILYPQCGHDTWSCSGAPTLNQDILNFLGP